MPPTMLTLTPPDAEWMVKAACAGYWDVMDGDPGQDVDLAKKICRSCPALSACQEWTLSLPPGKDVDGVAGAFTAEERQKIRRSRRRGFGTARVERAAS